MRQLRLITKMTTTVITNQNKMNNSHDFKVTYLNGPTAILEISGLRFITDPTFDPSDTIYPLAPNLSVKKTADPVTTDIGTIDYVLLSHDQHFDNFDKEGRDLAGRVGKIFTTAAGAERLKGNSIGLQTWESTTVTAPNGDEITITSTPARHGPAGIEKISGDVTGFILTVRGEKNFEIYITGDTVYYEGVATVSERYQPAYVFIFAGGAQPRGPFNVTMGTNDAIDTAYKFPKATIIPLHYEGWSHYTQGGDVLRRSFDALGVGDRLRMLTPGVTEALPV
jgi:L-ascorbate metabolism protein UlaG (beta-lactamase superfamily)